MDANTQPSWQLAIAELDRVLAKARRVSARAESALKHALEFSEPAQRASNDVVPPTAPLKRAG